MNWNNYGTYWHIDHIKSCASYDLTIIENQKECFNYKNLRPLEAIENLKKGKKLL
jgi:Uri superfamily endonuclease